MTTSRPKTIHLATQIISARMQAIEKMLDFAEAEPDYGKAAFETQIKADIAALRKTVTSMLPFQGEWQVSAFHDQFNVLVKRADSLHDGEVIEQKWWITGSFWKADEDPDGPTGRSFSYGPFNTSDEAEEEANDISKMEGAIGSIDGKPMEYEIDDVGEMHYGQACKHFDDTIVGRQEHVILVGVVVAASGREQAERYLHEMLPAAEGWTQDEVIKGKAAIDSWWIAEDKRHDDSDLDSAIFCIPGKQREAVKCLQENGLAN